MFLINCSVVLKEVFDFWQQYIREDRWKFLKHTRLAVKPRLVMIFNSPPNP